MFLKKTKKPPVPAAEPGQPAGNLASQSRLLDGSGSKHAKAEKRLDKQRPAAEAPPAAPVNVAARSRIVPKKVDKFDPVKAFRLAQSRRHLAKATQAAQPTQPTQQQNNTRVPVGGAVSLLKKSRLVD